MTESSRPHCILCGSADAEFRFDKEGYRHFDCRTCTALYLFPCPSEDELAAFYRQTGGEPTSSLCWTSSRRHVWNTWQWSLRRIESLAGRGPLLDVGCGGGQFLAFARQQGWSELFGVDLSREAAEAARRASGATVRATDLFEAGFSPESFAGIAMWDVLEHLPNARDVLRETNRLLRPGGVLVLSVPHRRGLAMRIFGQRALVVLPPEHLTYFTRRSLRRLFASASLVTRRIRCVDVYLREWTYRFAKARSREEQERAVYQSLYERLTNSSLFLAAMRVANGFLNLTKLGDELLAVAQKARDRPAARTS